MKKKSSFLDRDENGKDLGTASFAAVAVLILLLSIAAISYMGMVSRRSREEEIRAKEIGRLEDLKSKALGELKTQAEYFASQSIFEYMEEREREDESVEEQINDRLMDKFNSYLDDKEGKEWWQEGNRIVKIRSPVEEHFYVNVSEKRYRTEDVVPEAVTTREGSFGPTNQTSHYKLTGEFDFKLKNPIRNLHLERTTSFERNIDSPYPFLTEKMSSFESSLDGERSELGRMVKYMLTTLAQYRVGAGYGMDEIVEGIEDDDFPGITTPGYSTSEILNKEDIEISVNLAILLLISKHYRTVDGENVEALQENVSGGEKIEDIIDTYVTQGIIDPADLISLYNNYTYDDQTVEKEDVEEHELNLTALVSQTLYSIIDQFTLEYLDYFSLMPIVEEVYEGKQNIAELYDEEDGTIFDWFVEAEETDSGRELVMDWVQYTFERAGLGDTNLVREEYLQEDFNVVESDLPDVEEAIDDWDPVDSYPKTEDDFGWETEEPMLYKIKQYDSESYRGGNTWYTYTCEDLDDAHLGERDDYCDGCTKIIGEEGTEITLYHGEEKVGYNYAIFEVHAEIVDAKNHVIPFHSVDILEENPSVWDDFEEDYFYSKHVENVKEGVRNSVESIIQDYSDNIMEFVEDEEYKQINTNPRDDVSIFEKLQDNIDAAVSNVTEFYKENPSHLAETIHEELYDAHQPLIQSLKEFIANNYQRLIGNEEGDYVEQVTKNFTDHLIDLDPDDHDDPHIEFDVSKEDNIKEGLYEDSDDQVERDAEDSDVDDKNATDLLTDGGVIQEPIIDKLKEEVRDVVDDALTLIEEREVSDELSDEEKRSSEDGTIIQALDQYQYEGRMSYGVGGESEQIEENSEKKYETSSQNSESNEGESIKEKNIEGEETTIENDTSQQTLEMGNTTVTEEGTTDDIDNREKEEKIERETKENSTTTTLEFTNDESCSDEMINSLGATIDYINPSDPANYWEDTVDFSGSDTEPSDAYITSRDWYSSQDGHLSSGDSFSILASSLSPGSHTIIYEVEDNTSDSASDSDSLFVNTQPSATIEDISPDPATQGEDWVYFEGFGYDSAGASLDYEWVSDKDGILSTSESFWMRASELSSGKHTITFIVEDEYGEEDSDIYDDLIINIPPDADFEWDPVPDDKDIPMETEPIEFDGRGSDPNDPTGIGSIVEYYWEFGDGNDAYGEIVEHIYNGDFTKDEKSFEVTLTVTDNHGGTDTREETLHVDGRPYVTNFKPTNFDVETHTSIEIKFNQPIYEDSFNYVFDGPDFDNHFEEPDWNSDSTKVTLNPTDYYRRYAKYTLTLEEDIKDQESSEVPRRSPIKENPEKDLGYDFTFKTEEYPIALDELPHDGDEESDLTNSVGDVILTSPIMVTFDETMKADGDVDDLITVIEDPDGESNEVDLDLEFYWDDEEDDDNEGKTIVFTKDEDFKDETEYEVSVHLDNILSTKDPLNFDEEAEASLYGEHNTKGDSLTWEFVAEDTIPPWIEETEDYPSPRDDEEDVALDEPIEIKFNEKMYKDSFSIEIHPEVSLDDETWEGEKKVEIGHSGFEKDTSYTINVYCKDASLNELGEEGHPTTWSFTTEDPDPPEIESIFPKDGAEDVLTNTQIVVDFNKPVDRDTLSYSLEKVDEPNGGEVIEKSWNPTSDTVRLYTDLEEDTTYEFTVEGVTDQHGNEAPREGENIMKEIEFTTTASDSDVAPLLFPDIMQAITGTYDLPQEEGDNPQVDLDPQKENPLIPLTEDFMNTVNKDMINANNISNTEYRVPVFDEESEFIFWQNYTEDPFAKGDPIIEENITVDVQPDYLELEDEDITISSPEGVHYTNLLEHSSRAYETHWEVNIDEELDIHTESEGRIYLGEGTHHPTWVNRTLDADFSIRVPVFSAWELKDVDYDLEEEELKEITTVLDEVWEPAKPSLSVMIDTGEKLIPFMDNQVNTLRSYDVERIRRMERFLNENMDILKERLEEADIDFNSPEIDDPLYLAGRKISFDGESLEVEYEDRSGTYFSTTLTSDYQNNIYGIGQGTMGNVEGTWNMAPEKFRFEGDFDNPEPVGDDWSIEFDAPSDRISEEEKEYKASDYTDIDEKEMVVGDVKVENLDIGMRLRYDPEEIDEEVEAIIEGKIWETFDNTYHRLNERIGMNQQFIIKFLRTSMMELENKITNLMGDHIEEISFFVELNLEGRNSDIELSFSLVENDGISDFFEWVSRNLDKYVKNLFRDYVDSPPNTLHLEKEIADSIFVEYREKGEKETLVSTNLPTFSELLGGDVGEWRIRYGVKDGEGGDYLLFGNVYEK